MEFGAAITTTVAALLTLCIFSFLYKDNPFYKFAEHLVVGISAGYWVVILFWNVVVPNILQKIYAPPLWDYLSTSWWRIWQLEWWTSAPVIWRGEWWYILPTILGLLMWTRVIKKWAWVSRYPLAFYLGIATGVAIPLEMQAKVIEQLFGTVQGVQDVMALDNAPWTTIFNQVVIWVGIVSSLIYFFFSKEHKGVTGGVAQTGIVVLMIGFGASFGFTVMARVSLLIERIQFLLNDWIGGMLG